MSLLIKALEQAAKDRDSAKAGAAAPVSTAASPSAGSLEPALEPAPPPRSASPVDAPRQSTTEAAADRSTSSARSAPPLSLDAPMEQRRTATTTTAALAQIDAQQQRARAAAVMQASGQSGHVLAYVRGNPVMMFGALAALFGIGFGVYVYLQIAQPGFFVRQATTNAPETVPPPVVAPASQPAASDSATAVAPSPVSPAMTLRQAGAATSLTPAATPAPPTSAGSVGTAQQITSPAPISAASVISSTSPVEAAREPLAEREPDSRRDKGSRFRAEAAKAMSSPAIDAAEPASRARERIAVSSTAAQPRVHPTLNQAYASLQSGNIEEARAMYSKVSQTEPLNIDALLGLAYIAAQENRSDDAMKLYLRILQVNPRHASAQGALIGLMGRADPLSSETRLKQLIAREPSAFLHFVLGNVYADQSLWAQAQQAYFQAHHLEPDNADYAYNLAVGLDHLRQNKVALGYYRRAEQLATAQGRSNFNLAQARERISILSSPLD